MKAYCPNCGEVVDTCDATQTRIQCENCDWEGSCSQLISAEEASIVALEAELDAEFINFEDDEFNYNDDDYEDDYDDY